jgi:D-glycero-alpha-D-manno-heptose-7-phosphate kinase
VIITRTPFRISFFGGGTDYPVYYREHPGAVLASAINRYCYISLRRLPQFFDYKHRVVWSKTELVNDIDQIVHPSVRECLRYMEIDQGLEIHHDGDLPARSGLGSSSSFTVGLLNALYLLKGSLISKLELAEHAIHVEQNLIKEHVGSQDQTIAAFGGINVVRFNSCAERHISVEPLDLDKNRTRELENNLVLFFTGLSRTASEIASEQVKRISKVKYELAEMHGLVDEASELLFNGGELDDFGRMLHESWQIKRNLTNKISNSYIDEIYEKARKNGAIGGKLLGAGGGGFILLYIRPEKQKMVKDALGLLHVPFQFDFRGSQVIFNDLSPEEEGTV